MASDEKEQKPHIPTKSSMEILSELFSTFHAEPPLIIKREKSEDPNRKHKKKKKHKHKDRKHKKKDKKKKRSGSSSSDSEIDLANILIKQEKDAVEKKIKIEGTDLSLDMKLNNLDDKHKKDYRSKSLKKQEKNKIIVKDLKSSSTLKYFEEKAEGEITDSDSSIEMKLKRKHKRKESKKRSRSSSKDRYEKKMKIEDLRLKLKCSGDSKTKYSRDRSKEREYRDSNREPSFDKSYKDKDEFRVRDRDRYRDRSRERYRDDYSRDLDDYKRGRTRDKDDGFYRIKDRDREERDDKWCTRGRYRSYNDREYRHRSSSRERDKSNKFDKKKLLEIARKNAITMMKSGNLPAALTLGPQAQEKVIAAIKSGGKTIEELTDFCKTLSKKEELGELSSLSEKEDSDSDNDKPFHHPFQIKDRPTSITMNIKNSVPLPIKSVVERTSELRMQFPVSSGQQHRKGEEWMPVSPPPAKKTEEKSGPTTVSNIPLPSNINQTSAPISIEASPTNPPVLPTEPSILPTSSNILPGPQVFPKPALEVSVDIGSIVSQRLTAMRKLQENPNDVQALTQMYKSNKEMQSWATSKQQLGQFTGSTGAQILSQAELSSGYQAWAKKDQLQTAAPVSGGMGMHLLQKMGWKPGEGLGKEKTGTLEPLLLEVKLDKKGLVANEEQKGKAKKQKGVTPTVKTLQGKHPVSLLGEYASKRKLGAPQYILEFECGPDHKKNFLFKVVLNGVEYKPNVASNNKKEAKAAAATICLQQIGLLLS